MQLTTREQTLYQQIRDENARIEAVAQQMRAADYRTWERSELPVEHIVGKHFYRRQLFLPAGMFAVGEILKTFTVFTIRKGAMRFWTPNTKSAITVREGFVTPCAPATRKLGYALEDTVMESIHPITSGTTDIDEIEKQIIADGIDDPVAKENFVKHLRGGLCPSLR